VALDKSAFLFKEMRMHFNYYIQLDNDGLNFKTFILDDVPQTWYKRTFSGGKYSFTIHYNKEIRLAEWFLVLFIIKTDMEQKLYNLLGEHFEINTDDCGDF
jgi:hypothetical protein